jgi:hypothetical protein
MAVLRSADVAFAWDGARDAVDHELQVASDQDMTHLVLDDTLEAESKVTRVGPDGTYYWRLRSRSADRVWGEWSETRWFRLERFRVVTSVKTQGYPHDLAIDNGRVYVADGEAGLALCDVATPESPALLGAKMDSMNVAWGVAASSSFAYVAYGSKELYIVNVSRPESLKVAGELEYPQPGYGYDVALRDTFIYLAASAQFIVVNVAQPQYPNLVFQYRYPHDCRGVAVQDVWCYLACGQLGVAVWNIGTLPPTQTRGFDTPANALAVAVKGPYLYVADGRNGLVVANVSDPANPQPVATLPLDGYARGVSVCDSLAYVSCGSGGLAVVNVAVPGRPVLEARVDLPYVMCAQAEGRHVFCGDRDSGLVVVKIEE